MEKKNVKLTPLHARALSDAHYSVLVASAFVPICQDKFKQIIGLLNDILYSFQGASDEKDS